MQPTKITTPDTLWNTFYLIGALGHLRAEGDPVRSEDVERLLPFIRRHLGVYDRYDFVLPDLAGGIRLPRAPDAEDDDFGDWRRQLQLNPGSLTTAGCGCQEGNCSFAMTTVS